MTRILDIFSLLETLMPFHKRRRLVLSETMLSAFYFKQKSHLKSYTLLLTKVKYLHDHLTLVSHALDNGCWELYVFCDKRLNKSYYYYYVGQRFFDDCISESCASWLIDHNNYLVNNLIM